MDDGALDPAAANVGNPSTPAERLKRLLSSQKVAFVIVGGINTAVGFLAFVAWITVLGDRFYGLAVALAYSVSIIVAFILHRTFVFKVRGSTVRDFLGFVAVNSTGLGMNLVGMLVAVGLLGIPPIPAQILVLGLVAVSSFYGHRHISFRRTPAPPTSAPPTPAPSTPARIT
jgi:putative flippase GtrA